MSLCAEKSRPVQGEPSRSEATWRHSAATDSIGSSALVRSVYGPDSAIRGFEALEPEWNRLLDKSRYNSIFSTYEWQTTWWEELGDGELWIVAFRNPDDNQLVGIVPLYLIAEKIGDQPARRRLNLVGCIEVSDYLDMIVAKGWEEAVVAGLLHWLDSESAPQWDLLDLCNLPEGSQTYVTLPETFAAAGHDVQVFQEDVAPQFALPLKYDDYLLTQVDKKQRHEIRRKQRRAEREAAIGFYMVGPEHNLLAEIDDFVALQRASREDKAEFMTPEMRRFFAAVARRMLHARRLRLCFLTVNGEKAAVLFAFEYDKRFLLYNSGYDPDAYAQLSPGWVLLAYSIQYAIAAGCRIFDFMQGDEEYKYRFGSHDFKVMRVIVTRSR